MKLKNPFYAALITAALCSSCANQLPPSGGDDDKIPPRITSISPRPNTLNFRNNMLVFEFDEYVDRRSFEESFFIFPKPDGNIEFDWGGKDVEVLFSKPLKSNTTYVITIGNEFKDVRGSNRLEAPITFAFSTGNKIDAGKISGKVYAENYERVKIIAYKKNGKTAEQLNPVGNSSDYIIQSSPEGSFKFTNLSQGEYRLFAIVDEDRNNVFDKDVDKIAVPSRDVTVSSDTSETNIINFLLRKTETERTSTEFLKQLKEDSIKFIYSNIPNLKPNTAADQKLYFYFRNNDLSKTDIVNNFVIMDSTGNKTYRPVFNWLNDSLLEVFTSEKFSPGSVVTVSIDLTGTSRRYRFSENLSISSGGGEGNISGKVVSDKVITAPVYVMLINKDNNLVSYSKRLIDSLDFRFENVSEGNYVLFTFIDKNENGKFDEGVNFPFSPSEEFNIYESDLNVKGSWNVDNVFLRY